MLIYVYFKYFIIKVLIGVSHTGKCWRPLNQTKSKGVRFGF